MLLKLEPPKITKDLLLSRNSQETYMEHYLGIQVKKGLLRSPLRDDPNPTCSFYKNSKGDLIFKDFRGDFVGNFVSVVMYKFNVDYHQALKIIANDFGIIDRPDIKKNVSTVEYSNKEFEYKGNSIIQVKIKPFSEKELEWWESFGITEEILQLYNVFSCEIIFLNGIFHIASTPNNPIYGYYGGVDEDGRELWRIYFPFRTSYRFLSNWSASMIQGTKQLRKSDTLVITKSMKDVMCLKGFKIEGMAPNSETLFLTDRQWEYLQSKYKNIYLFYDNDLAGISNMNKIRKKYDNVKCIWIPRKYGVKDISDFHKKYGREKTEEFINNAIQWLNGAQNFS